MRLTFVCDACVASCTECCANVESRKSTSATTMHRSALHALQCLLPAQRLVQVISILKAFHTNGMKGLYSARMTHPAVCLRKASKGQSPGKPHASASLLAIHKAQVPFLASDCYLQQLMYPLPVETGSAVGQAAAQTLTVLSMQHSQMQRLSCSLLELVRKVEDMSTVASLLAVPHIQREGKAPPHFW